MNLRSEAKRDAYGDDIVPSASKRWTLVGESVRACASVEMYCELLIKFGAYRFISTPESQLNFNLLTTYLVKLY